MEKTDQMRCAGPGCHNSVDQQPGGHRQRQFCSDDCKQRAYRFRRAARDQQEIRERWSGFSEKTQEYLDWLAKRNDDRHELVEGIVEAIKRELGETPHLLSEEEAISQARLHCYLGDNRYLESTQRVFVELFRMHGHAMASLVATAINQERGHQWQAIETLPPAHKPNQQYGQWLLECGKRLKYHGLSLNVYRERCPGLFGWTDIYDIDGERSAWEKAVSNFSPEALLIALGHAHQSELLDRLLEQERYIAIAQASQAQIQLASAQRAARDCEKQLVAADNRLLKVQQSLEGERARRQELERKSDDGAILAISILEHKIKLLEQELEQKCNQERLLNVNSAEESGQQQHEAKLVKDLEQALLAVKEREDEINHLKTRIEKQYERRIAKQQAHIEELQNKVEKQSARKSDAIELEQARADLRQIRQDRAREQEAFHEIYDRASEQSMQLSVAANRIKDLEEQVKLERRGSEGVQIRFRDFVRMTHEKQLVRDQEEEKLPTREEMQARLLVVGERLQYRRLPVPHINPGIESWQQFVVQASDDQLGQAVTNVEHYYENLVYLDELEQHTRAEARERKSSKAS